MGRRRRPRRLKVIINGGTPAGHALIKRLDEMEPVPSSPRAWAQYQEETSESAENSLEMAPTSPEPRSAIADDLNNVEIISEHSASNGEQVMQSLEGPDTPMEDAESPNGVDEDDHAGGGGLFGSDSENGDEEPSATAKGKRRQLDEDEEELDPDDDEGREDRVEGAMDVDGKKMKVSEDDLPVQTQDVWEQAPLGRSEIPLSVDGEIYLLQLPKHIGIDPKRFDLKTFQPPTTDHHSSGPPSSTFSMHQVSDMTVRWRRSPNDPNVIQSNARILRWEDGSFTLQLAAQALVQYELTAKRLAPPQVNPPKPTPTSIKRLPTAKPTPYNPDLDTHTYLAFPHEAASTIRITNKVTTSLQVQSTDDKNVEDDALIRLKESLAAATKASKGTETMLQITEDPELAKKKAELAEKEKMRAQKRRQNQEEKERDRANRHLGRAGLRTTGAGLTVGGLEDEEGPVRPRAKPARKPRRRNSEYSEDEEDYRNRGKTKEDEYDEDDPFLAGSDEEPEVVDDDDDDVDMDMEEEEPRAKGKLVAKEQLKPASEDAAVRGKRKTVIEDDDDDE